MKASAIRAKSDDELREELTGLQREAFNLRMQRATGQLGQPSQIRLVRRDIARIKTILHERSRTEQA